MRSFILLAATAALITTGLDGCSRRRAPEPLRPHKEPHALSIAPDRIGRPNARPAGEAPRPAQ